MHEVSLAGGILSAVEAAARRDPFVRVSRLRLEAGKLAGVEIEALRFALEALAPGTLLAGAQIDIEQPRPGLVPGLRHQRAADRARRRLPAMRRLLAATHRRD